MHRKKMKELFNYKPQVFRNTELIYCNRIAQLAEDMGYKGILAEGADYVLGWRSPNFLYTPAATKNIKLLLKNYRLSDDMAFRFSERSWESWPLTADKFATWVSAINGNGNVVNLFMDYETFGEHQWADTGIFNFMRYLPDEILKNPDNDFKTTSEVINAYEPVSELDIHNIVSWADVERDLSAWLGNRMQEILATEAPTVPICAPHTLVAYRLDRFVCWDSDPLYRPYDKKILLNVKPVRDNVSADTGKKVEEKAIRENESEGEGSEQKIPLNLCDLLIAIILAISISIGARKRY